MTVSGRIDSLTAPELEDYLLGLAQSGERNFVVNLREVDFINSAGLKALSEMEPSIKESFDLVGFLKHPGYPEGIFPFYDSDDKAVGSF